MSQPAREAVDGPRNAAWRGTTNCDAAGLAISFEQPGGEVIRLRLNLGDACLLAASLAEYLLGYLRSTHVHSVIASGMPSAEVGPQDGVKV